MQNAATLARIVRVILLYVSFFFVNTHSASPLMASTVVGENYCADGEDTGSSEVSNWLDLL